MNKGTIIGYIEKYGNKSVSEYPFHDVDSLILSQFAYLKFDRIVSGLENGKSISLREMKEHPHFEDLFADERYAKDNRALFDAMLASKRFCRIRCNYHVNIIDLEKETQFSAITFVLDDGMVYVAFRGTDETLVGWKEDFNMFVEDSVPGQRMSTDYLNQVVNKVRCPIVVGGHSKGGNLAVYSSIFCGKKVQDKIQVIYDHDGPGMRPENKNCQEFLNVKDRIHKSVPHSSIVGLLLSFDDNCKVIASRNPGLAQHDPFSWLVKDGQFVEFDSIARGNRKRGEVINGWVQNLTDEERHLIVDTLYKVSLASGEKNLIGMKNHWKESLHNMNIAMKDVEPEKRKELLETIKKLFEYAIPEIKIAENITELAKKDLLGAKKHDEKIVP